MAKMFPKIFPDNSSSSGERKVFECLRDKAPSDWIVLHSYRLPRHKTVVFGEADFVVIAPMLGVFVLEIKSGGVGFDGTNWCFINRHHEKTYKQRGPFQQGREAMFEIEKIIKNKLGASYGRTNLIYGYGVIFTDEADFPIDAIVEDERWRLCQKTEKTDYIAFIQQLNKKFVDELKQNGHYVPEPLSEAKAGAIAKALRPIVDCVVPLKSFVEQSEKEIISLTEEQYACLDDIEINKQIVVTGGAGTGKTLIAVEEAKRESVDKKLGIFCFNKNLAEYIKQNIEKKNVEVHSLHAYLMKLIGNNAGKYDKDEEFFKKILPKMAREVAKSNGIKFDKIIVDEFQDLCTPEYLEFFDAVLDGGLMDGEFSFYGDFARQAIYQDDVSIDLLKNYAFFARKNLSINCRNTLHIGNELVNVTGYADKKYRLKITGEPVDFYVWSDKQEQGCILIATIKELKKKGFTASSIMVLSPNKRNKSIVGWCDEEEFIIGDYGADHAAYLAMFSTAHAYKGLESEIVILTDIEDYSDQQLMYIALSRARSKLIVLESAQASKQRKKLTIAR